jgi:hypothetical protein
MLQLRVCGSVSLVLSFQPRHIVFFRRKTFISISGCRALVTAESGSRVIGTV